MGRYRKLRLSRNSSISSTYSGRSEPSNGDEEKDKPDYTELTINGVRSALTLSMTLIDGSCAKLLQTLHLSHSDINSVAFGKNFMLATGSRYFDKIPVLNHIYLINLFNIFNQY